MSAGMFALKVVTPSEARFSADEHGSYRLVMRGDWKKDAAMLRLFLHLLRSFGYEVPHVWMVEEEAKENHG